MLRLSVACCLCLLSAIAHAENEMRYVTDKLYLTLTDQPDGTGAKLKTLTSGDAVTVLELGPTFSKVQTTDGIVGWLKASYLVTEAPSAQRPADHIPEEKVKLDKKIEELTKQNGELNKKLDEAAKLLDASKTQITALETKVVDAKNGAHQVQANAAPAIAEPQQAPTVMTTQPHPANSPLLALFIAGITTLTIGLFAGAWWVDRKVKKRFSGYRVY